MSVVPASPEERAALLTLQDVDSEIRRLEHRRANLPEQQALDERATTLTEITTEFAAASEELTNVDSAIRKYEGDIAQMESRRKTEDARLYSGQLSNEREVNAVREELSSLRRKKDDTEELLLEQMERKEELDSLITTLRERRTELTDSVAGLEASRDEAAIDIDAELAQRRTERSQAAGSLDAELLATYDTSRARQGDGVAVARLQGRTCQGCRIELTAIELEDVKAAMSHGLPRCEQCSRMLVRE